MHKLYITFEIDSILVPLEKYIKFEIIESFLYFFFSIKSSFGIMHYTIMLTTYMQKSCMPYEIDSIIGSFRNKKSLKLLDHFFNYLRQFQQINIFADIVSIIRPTDVIIL